MTPETVKQYQKEERSLIANRFKAERKRLEEILSAMVRDRLAPDENVEALRHDLAEFYKEAAFLKCETMGALVRVSLLMLIK